MRKQELHPRTAVLNKDQKNKSKRARLDALGWLAAQFPMAFDNSTQITPLKLGIMEDILQYADEAAKSGISKSKLREAVVLFTRRLDYLTCLKSRETRIDLQGLPVSEVTEEEASHAAAKIKKRVEKGVRNARKILAEKVYSQNAQPTPQNTNFTVKPTSIPAPSTNDFLPIYPFRENAYNTPNPSQATKSAASVVVKHKTTRQYDPSAVARLKEKLGLSRSMEEKKETSE